MNNVMKLGSSHAAFQANGVPRFMPRLQDERLMRLFLSQKELQKELPFTSHSIGIYEDRESESAMAVVTFDDKTQAARLYRLDTTGGGAGFIKAEPTELPERLSKIFAAMTSRETYQRQLEVAAQHLRVNAPVAKIRRMDALERHIAEQQKIIADLTPKLNITLRDIIYLR